MSEQATNDRKRRRPRGAQGVSERAASGRKRREVVAAVASGHAPAADALAQEVERLTRELDAARRRVRELEAVADSDPLLPMLNRRAFEREAARALDYASRYRAPVSLIYLDVNGLKRINDDNGHAAGDAALRHVAAMLAGNLRRSDLLGRLGGDELGVMLMQADEQVARAKADELCAAVGAVPLSHAGATLEISVSAGVAGFAPGESLASLSARADLAMYRDKCAR